MTENQEPYEMEVVDKRPKFEVEKVPQAETATETIILTAMQKGYDPDFIEKLLNIKIKAEENEARKEFFQALANFKAEAPPVKKDKFNKFFNSWYTSLGQLLDTYNPYLGKHGLSLSFPTPEQTDTTMTVICRLTHRMGHSEFMKMTGPVDQAAIGKVSGQRSRTPIQDLKSTFTFLRSATCEGVLGVTGTEAGVDDDGNSSGKQTETEYITEDQKKKIEGLMVKTEIPPTGFMRSLQVEDLDHLPASKYQQAINTLNKRLGNKPK